MCHRSAGGAVVKTMLCKRAAAGEMCRMCFREARMQPAEAELEDDTMNDS
jgi:hypothetical protein